MVQTLQRMCLAQNVRLVDSTGVGVDVSESAGVSVSEGVGVGCVYGLHGENCDMTLGCVELPVACVCRLS